MRQIDTLLGLKVKVFLDAFEVDGVMEHLDDEKIILNSDGSYFLIYKSKINMVLLNPDEVEKEIQEPPNPPEYYDMVGPSRELPHGDPDKVVLDPRIQRFAQNGVAEQNQYGSFLPRNLLEEEPPNIVDLMFGEGTEDVELSINAGTLRSEDALLARSERQKIIEQNKRDIEDGSKE